MWLLLVATAGVGLLAAAPWATPGLLASAVEAGRPKLVVIALLLLAGLCVVRPVRWPSLAVGVAAVLLHAAALRGVPAAPPAAEDEPVWRVVHANLGDGPDLGALAAWVGGLPAGDRPDAFGFQELRPGQPAELSILLPGYAPAWSLPRPDSRGGGLWLRGGVEAEGLVVEGVPSDAAGAASGLRLPADATRARPLARCTLRDGEPGGRPPLKLVLFSAARPSDAARSAARDAELGRLARLPREPGLATAWLGDFNAPPWSPPLRVAAAAAGMRLAIGGGLGGAPKTWPDGPLRWLGIPIDLGLVSAGVRASAALGPPIGSDHRPLVLTLTLTPPHR